MSNAYSEIMYYLYSQFFEIYSKCDHALLPTSILAGWALCHQTISAALPVLSWLLRLVVLCPGVIVSFHLQNASYI